MKKIILAILFGATSLAAQAQSNQVTDTHLLKHYYELRDALINSDGVTASYRVTDVINAGGTRITDATVKQLASAGKDLQKQRDAFAKLSLEVAVLAKKEKLTQDLIYQVYCPMKKTYWLSSEPIVKNPYYGKAMLTCGNITETIKP